MTSRRALAKAYVSLMDDYSVQDLSAAMAHVLAHNKVDVDLLAKDISAEILDKKAILTGTLTVAHQPSDTTVEEIEANLRKLVDAKSSQFDVVVNEDIIGGFVADTSAGTVDSSIITMLDKLEVA